MTDEEKTAAIVERALAHVTALQNDVRKIACGVPLNANLPDAMRDISVVTGRMASAAPSGIAIGPRMSAGPDMVVVDVSWLREMQARRLNDPLGFSL